MKRLVTPLTASVAIDFGDSKQLCRCSRLTRSGDEFAAFGLYNSDDCENGMRRVRWQWQHPPRPRQFRLTVFLELGYQKYASQ